MFRKQSMHQRIEVSILRIKLINHRLLATADHYENYEYVFLKLIVCFLFYLVVNIIYTKTFFCNKNHTHIYAPTFRLNSKINE